MEKNKFYSYLIKSHLLIFVGFFFFLHFIVQLPFLFFDFDTSEDVLNNSTVDLLEENGKVVVLYWTVLFAPFFETFFFQFSIIKIFRLISKRAWVMFFIAIPLSAVLFSIVHPYSVYYQVAAFFIGLVYAIAFFIGMYRKDLPAFLLVFIIHSSWNLFAFIMEELTV